MIASYVWWISLQNRGIRPRALRTNGTVDQVIEAFDGGVCGTGWKIIDDSNPRVAQSSLAGGIRQRIALTYSRDEARHLLVLAEPVRVTRKGLRRRPTKAHTLRMRLDGFERRMATAAEVQPLELAHVPHLAAALAPLKTRA